MFSVGVVVPQFNDNGVIGVSISEFSEVADKLLELRFKTGTDVFSLIHE